MICKICNNNFENIGLYHKHLRRHRLETGNFICYKSNCLTTFSNYNSYVVHYFRKHKDLEVNRFQSSLSHNIFEISCHQCKVKLSGRRQVVGHMCRHIQVSGNLKCPFCSKIFCNQNAFKVHVFRVHREKRTVESPMSNIENNPLSNNEFLNTEIQSSTNSNLEDSPDKFKIADSLNKLQFKLKYVHNISESTLQVITNHVYKIISNTKKEINEIFEEKLQKTVSNELYHEISSEINDIFEMSTRNTKYTRLQSSLASEDYIPPQTISLGLDDEHEECSYHFIPISETIPKLLKGFTNLENISHRRPSQNNRKNEYSDFYDGASYRNNHFFQSDPRIEILLYMDSFNLAQPLGAAKSKYKTAAIYYTLGNIPRPTRFKLQNMQLALLCLESNIKKFGMDEILKKLVDDLLKIENDGIELTIDSRTRKIKGSVVFIIADNLGSHQVGGFNENFSSSKYFCRTCKINLDDFSQSHRFRADYRNNESYNFDGNNIGETFGIKKISIFNKLKYFKICNPGLPPCIAHDLYEGIIAVDLNMYIQYFVSEKWFTFYTLNRRFKQIQKKLKLSTTFPYLNSKSKRLSGGAIQNYTFLILLPLIILSINNSTINYNDRVWQQVIRLIEICQIVSSYTIHYNQLNQLDYLIQQYLDERKQLFPDKSFLRKHHYIQHYSYYIRHFGPLMGYATLRFESKHQFFKNHIRATRNFINVTLSLTIHHQMYQAAIQTSKQNPSIIPNKIDRIKSRKISEDLKCEFRTDTLIFHEIAYKENLFVTLGRNMYGNILSLKIKDIFFDEYFHNIFLNGHIHVMDYDSLNGTYILHPSEEEFRINISDLIAPIPFSSCLINNEIRTSLKHSIPFSY